jgi:hypothetical protein
VTLDSDGNLYQFQVTLEIDLYNIYLAVDNAGGFFF